MARRVQSLYLRPEAGRYYSVHSRPVPLIKPDPSWPAPPPTRKYPFEKFADGNVWQVAYTEYGGFSYDAFLGSARKWGAIRGLVPQVTTDPDGRNVRVRFVRA